MDDSRKHSDVRDMVMVTKVVARSPERRLLLELICKTPEILVCRRQDGYEHIGRGVALRTSTFAILAVDSAHQQKTSFTRRVAVAGIVQYTRFGRRL